MKSRWARFLEFPLTRILLGSVFVVVPVIAVQGTIHYLPIHDTTGKVVPALASAIAAPLGYCFYVHWIERRRFTESALHVAITELGCGLATGTMLFTTAIGTLALLGALSIIFEAGVLLAAADMMSRRLWPPIGITLPGTLRKAASSVFPCLEALRPAYCVAFCPDPPGCRAARSALKRR